MTADGSPNRGGSPLRAESWVSNLEPTACKRPAVNSCIVLRRWQIAHSNWKLSWSSHPWRRRTHGVTAVLVGPGPQSRSWCRLRVAVPGGIVATTLMPKAIKLSKTRRGGSAAITPDGVRGALRKALLRHYDYDGEFNAALEQLWVERAAGLTLTPDWRTTPPLWWLEEPSRAAVDRVFESCVSGEGLTATEEAAIWTHQYAPVAAYFEALSTLAERFGLDRLGPEGFDTLHTWCETRQTFGEWWTAAHFSEGYQKFGPVIEVGEVVKTDRGVWDIDGHAIRLIDRDVRPVVRIDGREEEWDPTMENRSRAFKRLCKVFGKRHAPEIRAELDRMASLARDAGVGALDTRPNVARDIQWLFWHLRYLEDPAGVARRAGSDADEIGAIRKAVERAAKDAELSLRLGWTDWPEV
jgi:hypothetical protein